jgi:hypothetical protein
MTSKLNIIAAAIISVLCSGNTIHAQSMGISSEAITPDPSSILEMRTTDKGILIPRMTATERDNIALPATVLMLYNTTTNQYNFYNGTAWVYWESPVYLSVTDDTNFSTSSTTDVVVTGMEKTVKEAGTYTVHYNGQVSIPAAIYTTGFDAKAAAEDLEGIYDYLYGLEHIPLPADFGVVTPVSPGVYYSVPARTFSGTITLDGNNEDNPLFVIKIDGAPTFSANTTIKLINGATAANVFWVSPAAITVTAGTEALGGTVIKGTLLSRNAAIAVGANCEISGRLFTTGTSGAISTTGNSKTSVPEGESVIDFKKLTDFVLFTDGGAITNTSTNTPSFIGNIASNKGNMPFVATKTNDDHPLVDGIIYETGEIEYFKSINHEATFSLYNNGVLIPSSSRIRTHVNNPSDIALQGISKIEENAKISVRSKVDTQSSDGIEISVANRILTLIKVAN